MKLSLFYELTTDDPNAPGAVQQRFNEALEQCQLADEVGFTGVWAVEHHFLPGYSSMSCPEVFLTAAAARTQTIRLGHGVVLLTMNHPVRAAERTAVLDILSNGRLEFGTGRGTSEAELGGFNIDPEISRDMWDEALWMIPKMWTRDSFEHQGRFWTVPPRNVLPKPVQKPHPPLWVSGVSPQTFEIAADKGIGILSFSLSAPGQSEKAVQVYRQRIRNAEPVGAFVNDNVAAFTVTLCLEDDDEAKRVGGFAAGAYKMGAQSLYGKWAKAEGAWRAWYGRDYFVEVETDPDEIDKMVDEAVVCIGDPHRCITVIKHWEEIGVDQIMCLMQAGRIPHEKVMESIRLFGEHIIPYFKKREAGRHASRPAGQPVS